MNKQDFFLVTQDNTQSTEGTASQISSLKSQIKQMESEIAYLKLEVSKLQSPSSSAISSIAFFIGVFCALWAQNTGRRAWVWFFAGCIFGPLTLIILLIENSVDKKKQKQ